VPRQPAEEGEVREMAEDGGQVGESEMDAVDRRGEQENGANP
jgi:hypothetical protein